MPYSIDITSMSGGSAPVSYFICDENGNNCSFLGNTTGVYILPAFYQPATTLIVQAIDGNSCLLFQVIVCAGPETFLLTTEDGFVLTTEDGDGILF
jgi:hypothetical protein